jgi:hypothetical protein
LQVFFVQGNSDHDLVVGADRNGDDIVKSTTHPTNRDPPSGKAREAKAPCKVWKAKSKSVTSGRMKVRACVVPEKKRKSKDSKRRGDLCRCVRGLGGLGCREVYST